MADPVIDLDPLFGDNMLPFGAPPFDTIHPTHFLPALNIALGAARGEIDAITRDPAPATFENTVVALERVGAPLARIRRIFWALASARAEAPIRAIEAEVALLLSRHGTSIAHDHRLFDRVHAVWQQRDDIALNEAQRRLLTACHRGFVDGGALLDRAGQGRFAAVSEQLSRLSTRFGQNVLAATAQGLLLFSADDCAGLPAEMLVATSKGAAVSGFDGHLITLDRGDVETFLCFATGRDRREQLWRAFVSRCEGGKFDNRGIVDEILSLRQEQARLLGHANYADRALADTMAAVPEAADALLMRVWTPALAQAAHEQAELQQMADQDGVTLAPWDWRFYAERMRQDRFAVDGIAIKAALSLDHVRSAAFAVAGKLFGLVFSAREDIPGWHPDARVWEVTNATGQTVGLLYTDLWARSEKHGGAWMGALRVQEALDEHVLPLVYIVANFAKPAAGKDAGLSIDQARTLFHEFGHALHALLSDVTYPSQSGTAVARDFVEFPSKLMEHWIVDPEVLAGLGVPAPLAAAIGRADQFGQGFATVEYLASALVDLAVHRDPDVANASTFARDLLARLGLPGTIVPRHGLAHFTHIFGGGYASQYYSYLWSEVLDADAFEGFVATGSVFDPSLAQRLRQEVLARGDTRDPMAAYVAFRGRAPDEAALLRSRALLPTLAVPEICLA